MAQEIKNTFLKSKTNIEMLGIYQLVDPKITMWVPWKT